MSFQKTQYIIYELNIYSQKKKKEKENVDRMTIS